MVFKTLNFDYNRKPSIIYIVCCKIVLMFYNSFIDGANKKLTSKNRKDDVTTVKTRQK